MNDVIPFIPSADMVGRMLLTFFIWLAGGAIFLAGIRFTIETNVIIGILLAAFGYFCVWNCTVFLNPRQD